MVQVGEDGWFDCRRPELRALSGSLFRIRICEIDGRSCVFRVDRDVAARVRELLRPQVADASASDVCQVIIESCSFQRRSNGMLDVLDHWLNPWNDPSKWQLLEPKSEAYTVETFIAVEHHKELSILGASEAKMNYKQIALVIVIAILAWLFVRSFGSKDDPAV